MIRRFESSRDGVLEGPGWATHHVMTWILNDQAVLERSMAVLSGADKYAPRTSGGDVTERLAAFIEMLLYTDDGSTYRAMYRRLHGHLEGFDSQRPGLVKLSFTRSDFDRIDWNAVAEKLEEE